MDFEPTKVTMQHPGVTPLEAFIQKTDATRQKVKQRLDELYKLQLQQRCISILEKVNTKLDEKDNNKVKITRKGAGVFLVNEELVNVNNVEGTNKDVTMEDLAEVIDQVPAFKRSDITKKIEPYVEVWFS